MLVIHRDQLTCGQRADIVARYSPYELYDEFWIGFLDWQLGQTNCPYGSTVAGQAWDRGAEAASRLMRERLSGCEGCSF